MYLQLKISPPISDEDLNSLMISIWDDHKPKSFKNVLSRSLLYICAYIEHHKLVGYVNIAWDGDEHAFLLDTSVHKEFWRQGIGTKLVLKAINEVKIRQIKWLHVDFQQHLKDFYENCGFAHTFAGIIRLN